MLFDQQKVLDLVKVSLSTSDKTRTKDLTLAMGAALDDLSMRLRSKSYLTSTDVPLSSGDRETTFEGVNYDFRFLFAITMGDGDNYRVMKYDDPRRFLDLRNDPDAAAGKPEYFTQLKSSDGWPVFRFEKPLDEAETMTVYFFEEMTPENLSRARSISAVAEGTLAYFHGIATQEGMVHYAAFERLAKLSRQADEIDPNRPVVMRMSKEDRLIRKTVSDIAQGRSDP